MKHLLMRLFKPIKDFSIYSGMTDDELEAFRAQRRKRAAGSIYDGISAKEMARIQEKVPVRLQLSAEG